MPDTKAIGDFAATPEGEGYWRAILARMPRYPLRNWTVFLGFLAFVLARYVQLGARRDILATVRFEFILGIVIILLVGQQMASRKPNIGRAQPLLWSISLLFLAMIVQLPMAADPDMAQKIFMDRVIKFAFMTFFMVVMIESPRYLRWFLGAFLFAVFYITLESTQGLISGGLVWQNQGIMRLHGAVPIYEHPNSLGGVAMGALPFAAFLFTRVKSWILKLGLLALTGTSMICVIYSGSRTAYVGLVAFIMWWFFQSENKGKFVLWGLVAGVAALSVMPDEYIERFMSIGGKEKEGHSKEMRKEILTDAWTILMENPIGVGVASFPAVRRARFGRKQDTHNLYLEVATNLGWQGLIVFMALVSIMMAGFRTSAQAFRLQLRALARMGRNPGLPPPLRKKIRKHAEDLQFLVATSQAAAGFILIRLVLGLFGMDLYEVYWWFGAGLAMVLSGLVISTRQNSKNLLEIADNFVRPS
ncbi:MAG: polymerase [bacterium]|nr:polymerase [bacterium]